METTAGIDSAALGTFINSNCLEQVMHWFPVYHDRDRALNFCEEKHHPWRLTVVVVSRVMGTHTVHWLTPMVVKNPLKIPVLAFI